MDRSELELQVIPKSGGKLRCRYVLQLCMGLRWLWATCERTTAESVSQQNAVTCMCCLSHTHSVLLRSFPVLSWVLYSFELPSGPSYTPTDIVSTTRSRRNELVKWWSVDVAAFVTDPTVPLTTIMTPMTNKRTTSSISPPHNNFCHHNKFCSRWSVLRSKWVRAVGGCAVAANYMRSRLFHCTNIHKHRSYQKFASCHVTNSNIFAALHAMQTRSSDENSVCLSVCPSVCPSVTRVHCDKTVERFFQIYIPYERTFISLFWEEEWLVGATPSTWNFGSTDPRWNEIADFQPIIARS